MRTHEHPIKKVIVDDTAQGYFLTVSRGDKVLERRGPSGNLRYIMNTQRSIAALVMNH